VFMMAATASAIACKGWAQEYSLHISQLATYEQDGNERSAFQIQLSN